MHTCDVDGARGLEEGAVDVVRGVANQRAIHNGGHLRDAQRELVQMILRCACATVT